MNLKTFLRFFLSLLVTATVSLFILCTCGPTAGHQAASMSDSDASIPAARFEPCAVDEQEIDRLVAAMSLEEKIAQMFVVGVSNNPFYTPAETKKIIGELGVGGVGFQPFRSMFGDPATLAEMTGSLQEIALAHKPAIPLFVVLDQEGGTHQMFSNRFGGTDGPGNLALGALDDPETTRAVYAMMGREIRSWGANMSYSPVLDMPVLHDAGHMSTKGFSADPACAGRHGSAAVAGFADAGVIGGIKHFPGGGATAIDPHEADVLIDLPEDELRTVHLAPFAEAIKAGAQMVMVSSFAFQAFDADRPASLSSAVKIDLLRGELGFGGLITTGAMGMPAFDKDFGEDKHVLAIQTGADLMLHVDAGGREGLAKKIEAVALAVEEGRLPADLIEQSVQRILRVKMKYCLFASPIPDPAAAQRVCGSQEHQRIAKRTIADAITLVRNKDGLWPLDRQGKVLVISPWKYILRSPGDTWPNLSETTLGYEISRLADSVDYFHYMPGSFPFFMDRAAKKAEKTDAEVIVVVTYNAHYDPPQVEMVRKILKTGKPVMVVSLGTPYELADFPEAKTYLAVYSYRALAQQTAAETLFGIHQPHGRLPVEIPGLYPVGHSALTP